MAQQSFQYQFSDDNIKALIAQSQAEQNKIQLTKQKFKPRPPPKAENVGTDIERMAARCQNWHQKTQNAIIDIRYLHQILKSPDAKDQLIKDVKNEIMQYPVSLKDLLKCLSSDMKFDVHALYVKLEEKNKHQDKDKHQEEEKD